MKIIVGVVLVMIVIALALILPTQRATIVKAEELAVIKQFSNRLTWRADKQELVNEQNPRQKHPLDQWPMECEGAAARLDFAVIDTKKTEGAYLIIVARLGTGENSSRLNAIRLAIAREYVLRRGSDLKYVMAQGERVKGLGRLEVYVGGKLSDILPLRKNAKGFCP